MKYTEPRRYADPEAAARRLVEIASTVEPGQDGRIYIERINAPFLFQDRASPAEYGAGMKLAVERGWLVMHESGPSCGLRSLVPSCSRDGAASDALKIVTRGVD